MILLFFIFVIMFFICLNLFKHKHSGKNGLQKIWHSAKGMLVIISLIICSFLAFFDKMTPSFAAVIGSLVSVMLVVHSRNDIASMGYTPPIIPNTLPNLTGDSGGSLMNSHPPSPTD